MLEVQNLTVRTGSKTLVEAATLRAVPGKLTGLIGPNSAGKTSLLRAIAGVLPSSGTVHLCGEDARTLAPRLRARRLAWLPQQQEVAWSLPAREIVALGRFPHQGNFARKSAEDNAIINAVMEETGTVHLAARPFPVLSGGEKARILLARALAVAAPVLLADEPVAALDPGHQLQVMELLKTRAVTGTAIVAIIHDLALASRFFDHLYLMDQGRIIAEGPPDKVLTDARLAQIYGITALRGETAEGRWLLPWTRTGN